MDKLSPLILLLLLGCSSNSPTEQEISQAKAGKLNWESCEKSEDCTAVTNAVCDPKAINKKYADLFYDHYYGKRVEACELRPGHEEKTFQGVQCVSNKCEGVGLN